MATEAQMLQILGEEIRLVPKPGDGDCPDCDDKIVWMVKPGTLERAVSRIAALDAAASVRAQTTPDLRRVHDAYLDNERRRKEVMPPGSALQDSGRDNAPPPPAGPSPAEGAPCTCGWCIPETSPQPPPPAAPDSAPQAELVERRLRRLADRIPESGDAALFLKAANILAAQAAELADAWRQFQLLEDRLESKDAEVLRISDALAAKEAECERRKERIAELEAALRPFADFGSRVSSVESAPYRLSFTFQGKALEFTDFQRAHLTFHSALTGKPEEGR